MYAKVPGTTQFEMTLELIGVVLGATEVAVLELEIEVVAEDEGLLVAELARVVTEEVPLVVDLVDELTGDEVGEVGVAGTNLDVVVLLEEGT